jgi:LysM repeat protein
MKSKSKPGSKIPTTKINTNVRKKPDAEVVSKKTNSSLIKKNEFALILLGALLLTTIIFFLFFKSSGSKTEPTITKPVDTSFTDLDKRIEDLENTLPGSKDSIGSKNTIGSKIESLKNNIADEPILSERVARLETAFSLKFDSLAERMLKLERSIASLKARPVAKPKVSVKKTAVKKPVVKKTVKKAPILHTVKKGETLYSIGKKYKITIATLRKLNKLSKTSKIYPGNNLIIR